MLTKDNEYMMNLYKAGNEYEEKREAIDAKKPELVEKYGYGSPELEKWHEEKKALVWPFKDGECKAYRAWESSVERGDADLVMDDFLWDREVEDFLNTLKAAGIQSFIYTNSSSASMENIHAFIEQRCILFGPAAVTRKVNRFGSEREEKEFGLRFTIA